MDESFVGCNDNARKWVAADGLFVKDENSWPVPSGPKDSQSSGRTKTKQPKFQTDRLPDDAIRFHAHCRSFELTPHPFTNIYEFHCNKFQTHGRVNRCSRSAKGEPLVGRDTQGE
ncbi:hypothetical protein K0M31_010741 [Melipona bicolor]|uniref:Uncharacterized protein n=1 Tax=Melipona bicolor TaxID=60889 RepID=A0AA40FLE9_9HYME|nr:hypothetical protein K0M31_010741 [Melipona bicolor]